MVRSGSLRALLAVSVALAGGIGQTQPASQAQMGSFAGTEGYGTMNLQSNLGTFRSIDGEGRFDIAFKGSLLVSKLEGKVTPVGAIKKEYDKFGRQVYFGEGRLVVEGKWRAIQWFGSNMRTTWYGKGIILILGEFDKDLKTGSYWYEDANDKGAFPVNGVVTLTLPESIFGAGATPRKRGG